MPTVLRYLPDDRLGIARLSHTVDAKAFVEAMARLYGDERWQPGYAALWDLRGVTQLVVDVDGINAIVAETKRLEDRLGDGRAAFVVKRDIHELLSKLLIHLTRQTQRERRSFDQMVQALAWLGVDRAVDEDPTY